MDQNDEWTIVLKPTKGWFVLNLRELWRYRDLLMIFVRRDLVTVYKQTILGPLWYVIQPILTTLMFVLVFGKIAQLSTDGLPPILFYLLGTTIWSYFSDCLNLTSNTFVANQAVFGKVYFPRVMVPGSIVVSNLVKFAVQFTVFLILCFYYSIEGKVFPNLTLLWLPLMVLIMAVIAMGFGMLFSSLTTKYRDLAFLLTFGVQLWMYVTPIIYPLSSIPERFVGLIRLNPLTSIVETLRYGFLGQGLHSLEGIAYSAAFAIAIFVLGFCVFNRVEKNFMDTV
jgi:lipopolysaccharide transport system permease protein